MNKYKNQTDFILSYYKAKPNVPIAHPEVVQWATREWFNTTGKVLADADRAVRKLSQLNILVKVKKGVYMFDPNYHARDDLQDFTPAQKQSILERDGYRCVVCGRGKAEGVDLQIDHIKPKDDGGQGIIENGQVLCGQHNFIKKNYSQTEAGKRFFIKLCEQAVRINDTDMISFCDDIFSVYEKHGYDNQIKR